MSRQWRHRPNALAIFFMEFPSHVAEGWHSCHSFCYFLVVGYSWNDHHLTFVDVFRSGSPSNSCWWNKIRRFTETSPPWCRTLPETERPVSEDSKLRELISRLPKWLSGFFGCFLWEKWQGLAGSPPIPLGLFYLLQVPGTFLPWICVWCRWYMSTCPQTGDSQIQRSSSPGVGAPLWLGVVSVGDVTPVSETKISTSWAEANRLVFQEAMRFKKYSTGSALPHKIPLRNPSSKTCTHINMHWMPGRSWGKGTARTYICIIQKHTTYMIIYRLLLTVYWLGKKLLIWLSRFWALTLLRDPFVPRLRRDMKPRLEPDQRAYVPVFWWWCWCNLYPWHP